MIARPAGRSRRDTRSWLVGLVAGLVLCGGGLLATVVLGSVLLGPQKCPDGRIPATNPEVGGRCFEEGARLPAGWAPDPGGNSGLPDD